MIITKLDFLSYISAAESVGVSSTTFTLSASYLTEFGEITRPLALLCRSRSSKVTDFGNNYMRIPIRPSDYTNLASILHRFPDIALDNMSKIAIFGYPLVFNSSSPTEGFPWDDLGKNFTWMSTDGQRTKRRRNIAENFNRLSRVHERYRRQTTDGRQTDRRVTTNGRAMTYSERVGDDFIALLSVCSHFCVCVVLFCFLLVFCPLPRALLFVPHAAPKEKKLAAPTRL